MTDPYIAQLDEYHKFVGMFITAYAGLEYNLRSYLEYRSGMEPKVFTIMVGFPRTSDAIKKLKQIVADSNLDVEAGDAIADAFTQLDTISKLRDRLVHYGGHPLNNGQFLVRSRSTELSQKTGKPFDLFDRQELWNAAIDLGKIEGILAYRLGPQWSPDLSANGVRHEPWRYIPPGQRRSPKSLPE